MKRNILFVFDRAFIPTNGGVQRVTCSIANYLELNGNFNIFFLSKSGQTENQKDNRQFFLPVKKFHARINCQFFTDFCIEHNINIVVHQSAIARTFPYVKECKKLNIPIVSVFHQPPDMWKVQKIKSIWRNFPIIKKVRRWIKGIHIKIRNRALYKDSSALVFLSDKYIPYFEKTIKNKGDELKKIYVIPNMIPLNPIKNNDAILSTKKKELLFVGRLENSQKRVDLLLKIWAKLENKFPQWSLKIVGGSSKEDEAKVKKIAGALNLKHISFEGFQNPENYYRDASIFCMTSAYEGFGLVLVEAATFGCVPVAFDSFGAVRDIITDNEDGKLVPAFDLDAYAGALAQLMSDDVLRERLARNAISIAGKFSPEIIGAKWETLFSRL